MEHDYVLLTEKEEMWAKMLIEVLEDNHIPCASLPVYGAALALKAGKQELLRVYVPSAWLQPATDLLQALFDAEPIEEE